MSGMAVLPPWVPNSGSGLVTCMGYFSQLLPNKKQFKGGRMHFNPQFESRVHCDSEGAEVGAAVTVAAGT